MDRKETVFDLTIFRLFSIIIRKSLKDALVFRSTFLLLAIAFSFFILPQAKAQEFVNKKTSWIATYTDYSTSDDGVWAVVTGPTNQSICDQTIGPFNAAWARSWNSGPHSPDCGPRILTNARAISSSNTACVYTGYQTIPGLTQDSPDGGAYYACIYRDNTINTFLYTNELKQCPAHSVDFSSSSCQCDSGYVSKDGECIPAPPPEVNICQAGTATPGPIIPATGEKIKSQIDYTDQGAHPLNWVRHYRSTNTFEPSALGMWRHSHWAMIDTAGSTTTTSAKITFADGSSRRFSRIDSTQWATLNGADKLETLPIGDTRYTSADDDSVWQFAASGYLRKVTERNGWIKTYTYNATNQLIQITNQFGRSITLTYNSGGYLVQVTPPDGKAINYEYDSAFRPSVVRYATTPVASKTYLYENPTLPFALTGIIDENNSRLSTYVYDAQGRAISSELSGTVERYSVQYPTSTGISAQVTDPLGTTRNYNYATSLGRLSVTSADKTSSNGGNDAASRVQSPLGLIDTETDFTGFTTQFTWDTARRLPTQVVRAAGRPEAQTVATQWHPTLRLPVLVTEAGRTMAYTYDALGNKLTETITDTSVPAGTANAIRVTTWTYNAAGLVATEKAPNNAITTYTYNSAGLPLTVRNALGHTTTLAYLGADGAAGRVTSMTAPNGAVTAYTYDARGRMLSSTTSAGTSTLAAVYTYTPSGQLASAALPSGHTINYSYDAAQRLVAWQDNRGARGNYTLDAMGNRTLEQIKNTAGQVVWQLARSINAINRVTSEVVGAAAGTVNNNLQSTYGYNANGSLVSEANALAQTTQYGLDGLRRVTAITNAANSTAALAYNALDAVTTATDFKGATTATARDALGNALTTASPDAGSQSAQYDALGLPKQITDALGQATTITRDALGRPTLITQADGRSTQLRYDLTGTTYNAAGFANASKGYLSEIVDTTDKTSYLRDGFGRVIKKTQQLAPFTSGTAKSVAYSYAASTTGQGAGVGQINSITYPSNTKITYLYSPAGQITQLNWGANPLITNITYTPLGQPSSWNWEFADTSATTVLPATRAYDSAGRVIATELGTYTYDAAGRITALTQQLFKPANTTATSTAVTATTAQFSIGYDALGRITSFSRAGSPGAASTAPLPTQTAVFSYDSNGNRLTSLQTSVQTTGSATAQQSTDRSYTVDPAGNRLLSFSQTLSTNGSPGATSAVTYQHDANGALTSDGLRRYEFDAANRLAAMTVGAVDTSPTTRYVHNALGQRLFKTEPQFPPAAGDENDPAFMASLIAFFSNLWGGNTGAANPSASEKLGFQYYYDEDGSLLYELGSGGANSTGSAHYVYLPTPSGPMPVAFYNGSKHYAVQTDHLNTPRRLTQSDKKVAWQWAFSAFGDEQPTTGKNRYVDPATTPNAGSTTVADVTFNLRYPGQYYDKESGLSYNYFRSYDSRTGRYSQSDPIDLAGGWNRFAYVENNPLSMTDPMGLQAVLPGPFGVPVPIYPIPGVNSPAPPPAWDPTDGPAPGTGTIIWPPGFSPNPPPKQCQIDVPPPKGPPPPRNDCDSQLNFCMSAARAVKSYVMKGACIIQYAICRKLGQ
jgi:RHS repeat-associated protein